MSDRRYSATRDRARDQLRDLISRIERLENGGAIAGRISLGSVFTIGGKDTPQVQVEVVDTGGGSADLVFTNLTTGVQSTITL